MNPPRPPHITPGRRPNYEPAFLANGTPVYVMEIRIEGISAWIVWHALTQKLLAMAPLRRTALVLAEAHP